MMGSVRSWLAALVLAACPHIAEAQAVEASIEPSVEHALDIALDPKSHAGKRYRIAGCLFQTVRVNDAVCDIRRAGRGPSLGTVFVDMDVGDVAGRRRLVETCAAFDAPPYRCAVDIVADVRVNGAGEPLFLNARAVWP